MSCYNCCATEINMFYAQLCSARTKTYDPINKIVLVYNTHRNLNHLQARGCGTGPLSLPNPADSTTVACKAQHTPIALGPI